MITRLAQDVREMVAEDRRLRARDAEDAARRPRETARERLARETQEAELDIAPHERARWHRIKGQFRGTPAQRVEQFHEFLESEGADQRDDETDWAREQRRYYRERATA